jgi:hypothetical protein
MALAGFDKVIPFDQTVEAMFKVGQMIPPKIRCTGKADYQFLILLKQFILT